MNPVRALKRLLKKKPKFEPYTHLIMQGNYAGVILKITSQPRLTTGPDLEFDFEVVHVPEHLEDNFNKDVAKIYYVLDATIQGKLTVEK